MTYNGVYYTSQDWVSVQLTGVSLSAVRVLLAAATRVSGVISSAAFKISVVVFVTTVISAFLTGLDLPLLE